MAALIIGISYTAAAGTAYNFQIDNFSDNAMPRSYVGATSFELSANGSSILGGPAYKEKFQWVISTVMQKATAVSFDAMFRAWDLDRSNGKTAACGIIDKTWGDEVDTDAVFVTAPTYNRLGNTLVLVSFGLQEV